MKKNFLDFNIIQLLNNNIHAGNIYKKNDPFSSSMIKKIRQNISIINMKKTNFHINILKNQLLNIISENQIILLNDSNLFGRTSSIINKKCYNKYIISVYDKWKTGSISNFFYIQFKHKLNKIKIYRNYKNKEVNPILLNLLVEESFEINSFNYILPNIIYNLYNHNDIIHKECQSKGSSLISSLDTDIIGSLINYIPIPGNDDSISSLIFYRSILLSVIKFSMIKNIYYYHFLKKKNNKIKNFKKLCIYNFLYKKL